MHLLDQAACWRSRMRKAMAQDLIVGHFSYRRTGVMRMRMGSGKQEQFEFLEENLTVESTGGAGLRASRSRFIHIYKQYVPAGPPMVPLLGGILSFVGEGLHPVSQVEAG